MRPWLLLPLVVACSCSASTVTPSEPTPPGAPATAPAAPTLPALGMNDVSVLFPLPAALDAPGYLTPESSGTRGPLLTSEGFSKIPTFPVKPADGLDYARMRVVAARFDGCFPAPLGCEAQIRLVMQPIRSDKTARDSALHLFYRLTADELVALVTELRNLRSLAPEVTEGPLDVHPALVAQGVDGPYGTALTETILRHAGDENLSRMTFFLRAPPTNEVWFFGGFDRKEDGAFEPLDIVSVGRGNQRVIHTKVAGGFDYDFTPVESEPETTSPLLSSERAKTAPAATIDSALAAFLRIENPTKYGPDALPCAGCHVSTVVTSFGRDTLGRDLATISDTFTSKHDLSLRGRSASTPSSLRAFGWFGAEPMISQRVVNETAMVVDDLEERVPRTTCTDCSSVTSAR